MKDDVKLGRFGHHPDPVIDYEVEVDAIEGGVREAENGILAAENGILAAEYAGYLAERIRKALDFQVGGTERGVSSRRNLLAAAERFEKIRSPSARSFVPDALERLASLYRERGAVYGDNYLHAGEALLALFPRGITLRTAEDFGRFHLVVHLESKLSRYAMAMEKTGRGHADSLDDLSVYAQMLQEFDHDPR